MTNKSRNGLWDALSNILENPKSALTTEDREAGIAAIEAAQAEDKRVRDAVSKKSDRKNRARLFASVSSDKHGSTVVFRLGSKDIAVVECTHKEGDEFAKVFAPQAEPEDKWRRIIGYLRTHPMEPTSMVPRNLLTSAEKNTGRRPAGQSSN